MRKEVDHKLDKLLQLDVIESVIEPPSWGLDPLVIVPTKKRIQGCETV